MEATSRRLVFLALLLSCGIRGLSEERKAPGGPEKKKDTKPAAQEAGEAVAHALQWLRKHQDADGGWKAAGFTRRCSKPCENADPARYGKGLGEADHDVGVSALAALAFVRHARSSKQGLEAADRQCLRRACAYLLGTQVKAGDDGVRGRFGAATNEAWIYDHALATLALAEAIGVAGVDVSKAAVEEATKLCLRAQNDGAGWRYGVKPGESDTSVTSWMVQALEAAERAKVKVPKPLLAKAMTGALAWYDRATSPAGKVGYIAPGDEGSRLMLRGKSYPWSKRMSSMTAAAVLGRLLAGDKQKSRNLESGIDLILTELPEWREEGVSTVSFYYWYYGTQALSHRGGPAWQAWSPAVRQVLIGGQRRGDIEEAGSWDPIDEWGSVGGRVYSTAINALTLIPLVQGK